MGYQETKLSALAPAWLREKVGQDLFEDVIYVELVGASKVTEADLAHLRAIPRLSVLDLTRAAVTDAHMEQVGKLTQLEILILYSTQITDAGLAHLTGLTRLQRLRFRDNEITDADYVEVVRAVEREYREAAATNVRGTKPIVSPLIPSAPIPAKALAAASASEP